MDKQIVIHLIEILESNKKKQMKTCNILLVDQFQKQYSKGKRPLTGGYRYTIYDFIHINSGKAKMEGYSGHWLPVTGGKGRGVTTKEQEKPFSVM